MKTPLYKILRSIYRSSYFYKRKRKNIEKLAKINEAKSKEINNYYLENLFRNNLIIQNGPFKGLNYINSSVGSQFLPKLLGSYEEPIQKWINQVISSNYKRIINIGCAEGYYSCGFAMKMPKTHVIAIDIDQRAIESTKKLIEINKLNNVDVVEKRIGHDELNYYSIAGSLIFCDIEGFENYLIDPLNVPNLKNVDLIIEAHDFKVPNITDNLISRFYLSHSIEVIVDYPFRINKYIISKKTEKSDFEKITNEIRPKMMKWLYLKSVNFK